MSPRPRAAADGTLPGSVEDGDLPNSLMIRLKNNFWYKVNILKQGIKDDHLSYKVNYPGFLKTDTQWVRIDSQRLRPYILEDFVQDKDYAFILAGESKPHKAKPKTVPDGAKPSTIVPYPEWKERPPMQHNGKNKNKNAPSTQAPRRGAEAAAEAATGPADAPAGAAPVHTGKDAPVPVARTRPGARGVPVAIDLTPLHQEWGITATENNGEIHPKRPLPGGEGPSKVPARKRPRPAAKAAMQNSVLPPPPPPPPHKADTSQPKAPAPTSVPAAAMEEDTLAGNVAAELQPSDAAPSISVEEGVEPAPAPTLVAADVLLQRYQVDGSTAPQSKLAKYMSTVPERIMNLAAQPNWTVDHAWSCQDMALTNPVCWAMAALSMHSTLARRIEHGHTRWIPVTLAMLRFVEPWQDTAMLEAWASGILGTAGAADTGAAAGKDELTPGTSQRTKKRKIHTPHSMTATLAEVLGSFKPDARGNLHPKTVKGAQMASLLFGEYSGDEEDQGQEGQWRRAAPSGAILNLWDTGVQQRYIPGDYREHGGPPSRGRRGRGGGGGGRGGGRFAGGKTVDATGDINGTEWDALNALVGIADRELSDDIEQGAQDGAHPDNAAGGESNGPVLQRAAARQMERKIRRLEEKLRESENREQRLTEKLRVKIARTAKTPITPPEVLTEERFQAEWASFAQRRAAVERQEQALLERRDALIARENALARDVRALEVQVKTFAKEKGELINAAVSVGALTELADPERHAEVQGILTRLRATALPQAPRPVFIPPLPHLDPIPARQPPPVGPPRFAYAPPRINTADHFPPPSTLHNERMMALPVASTADRRMTPISPIDVSRMQHFEIPSPMPSSDQSDHDRVQKFEQELKQMTKRLAAGKMPPGPTMLPPVRLDGNTGGWNAAPGTWKGAQPPLYNNPSTQNAGHFHPVAPGPHHPAALPPSPSPPPLPSGAPNNGLSSAATFSQLETKLGSSNPAIQLIKNIAQGRMKEPDAVNRAATLLLEALQPMIKENPQYGVLRQKIDESSGGVPSQEIVHLVRSLIVTLSLSEEHKSSNSPPV